MGDNSQLVDFTLENLDKPPGSGPVVEKTVKYAITYESPSCFDDGGINHIENWNTYTDVFDDLEDDNAARLKALEEKYHKTEYCRHGRHSRVTKIEKRTFEKTEDGWERESTVELDLPRRLKCICGQTYQPLYGETPCHTPCDSCQGTGYHAV